MRVAWSRRAERDRTAIFEYIAARDAAAAARIDRLFTDAADSLAAFPLLGHAGDIAGTRELTPHPNYRLIYEVVGETVRIMVLIHAARSWPPRHD